MTRSANSLTISWPHSLASLTLQQSPDLVNWTPSDGISNDGTNNFINVTAPTGSVFFRLAQ
jgi:hypothetical protein